MDAGTVEGSVSDVRSQPDTSSTGPLGLDPADLATCVSCGLCLPHCPTFRVTGEEAHSPRGRVDAMRGVQLDGMEIDDSFAEFMATCVQCRGCEPACPSGVPFGSLMEQTRSALVDSGRAVSRSQRIGFSVLGRHRTLLAGSTLLALGQRLRLVPGRLGLPRLPIRRRRPSKTMQIGPAMPSDSASRVPTRHRPATLKSRQCTRRGCNNSGRGSPP